jgi:hypothetical protein
MTPARLQLVDVLCAAINRANLCQRGGAGPTRLLSTSSTCAGPSLNDGHGSLLDPNIGALIPIRPSFPVADDQKCETG